MRCEPFSQAPIHVNRGLQSRAGIYTKNQLSFVIRAKHEQEHPFHMLRTRIRSYAHRRISDVQQHIYALFFLLRGAQIAPLTIPTFHSRRNAKKYLESLDENIHVTPPPLPAFILPHFLHLLMPALVQLDFSV